MRLPPDDWYITSKDLRQLVKPQSLDHLRKVVLTLLIAGAEKNSLIPAAPAIKLILPILNLTPFLAEQGWRNDLSRSNGLHHRSADCNIRNSLRGLHLHAFIRPYIDTVLCEGGKYP